MTDERLVLELTRARVELRLRESAMATLYADLKRHADHAAGLHWYDEVAAAGLPPVWVNLAEKAVALVSVMLGVERPAVRWFQRSTPFKGVAHERAARGWVVNGVHEVWLGAVQRSPLALCEVVAHEAKHLAQQVRSSAAAEREALSYGRTMAPLLLESARGR